MNCTSCCAVELDRHEESAIIAAADSPACKPGAYEKNPQRLRRCDDERPSYPGGRGAARRYPERKADAHGGAEARAYSAARGCRNALDRSRLIREPQMGAADGGR